MYTPCNKVSSVSKIYTSFFLDSLIFDRRLILYGMARKNIKKLWRRVDTILPGASEFVDPIKVLGLSKKDEKTLDFVAGIFLAPEKSSQKKTGKRRQFTKKTKLAVLVVQGYKCKICKDRLDEADFDHIDDDRSNNSITNCQALCPNCHAKKTRKKNLRS